MFPCQIRKAGYSVRRIKPSLEDVFVSLIEGYDKEHKDESKKS